MQKEIADGASGLDTALWRARLLHEACTPYRRAGRFAYFFARGKLRADPVYRAILQKGLLQGRFHLLDLGCGQALLFAWFRAAACLYERGDWPESWPPPPKLVTARGIELMGRDVERAVAALGLGLGLGSNFDIRKADITHFELGSADAVMALDVMHYLAPAAQRELLGRIHTALPVGGVLLLRVADDGGGLRARYTRWVDRIAMGLRGHPWAAPNCRSLPEWQALLATCGFTASALPASQGTPFANVLLIATACQAAHRTDQRTYHCA